MTLRKGFGAELALPHGDDLRYDLSGIIVRNSSGVIRSGLFPNVASPLLTSTGTMAVGIAAFTGVAVRDGGPVFLANDGAATVTPDPAPASNSRLDVIYAIQHDDSSYVSAPDSDNLATFGILKGVASASPVRNPAGLPAGALELGTILIPSTATNSGSAGVAITDTYLYTCMAGGVLRFRTAAERDAFAAVEGQAGYVINDALYIFEGSWINQAHPGRVIPTAAVTGSGTQTVSVDATGLITLANALTIAVDLAFFAKYPKHKIRLLSLVNAGTATFILRDSTPSDDTTANYAHTEDLARNGGNSSATPTGPVPSSWPIIPVSNALVQADVELLGAATANPTTGWLRTGVHSNPVAQNSANAIDNSYLTQQESKAFTGFKITFSAAFSGTIRVTTEE